ncbi:MAG: deoxyribose-phosphate aldolase [Candidatus Paceibacterota bacterium]|jgi:deoxyribose-phosphate aldolase
MEIAKAIDQTFLKKEATEKEVKAVAKQAKEYGFRGFCVFPEHTKTSKGILAGSGVKVTTLIDEPMGSSSHSKRMEMAKKAKSDGSDEIDVVMKIEDFKNGNYEEVLADLRDIAGILPTKVIIGSGYLTDEEIKKASGLVKESGAICVKTATLLDPLDNSELQEKAKHVSLMKESASGLLIKAAGSIRTLSDLYSMMGAGADIIGTSSGVEIVDESKGISPGKNKDGRIIE